MKHELIEDYYRENYDRLVKTVSRRAGSPEGAEDVVQEAFERALRYQAAYDESRPFEGWFVAILNSALADYQKAERLSGMTANNSKGWEEATDEDKLFIDKLTDEAKKLLSVGDTADERYLLELYFFKGYKLREVIQITCVNYRRALYLMTKFREEALLM